MERALFIEDKLSRIPEGEARNKYQMDMINRGVINQETVVEIVKLRKLKSELDEKLSPVPPPPPPKPIAPPPDKPLSQYREGANYRDKVTGTTRRFLQGQFV
jgi:hypothetical protein